MPDQSDGQPPSGNVTELRPRARTFPPAPRPDDAQLSEQVDTAQEQGRGRAGGPGGQLTRAKRRRRVLELLAAGLTEEQVGQQVGMSQQGVSNIKTRELKQLAAEIEEKAQELRSLDLVRIEAAIRAIYQRVLKGELNAIDRMLKLIDKRQKLLGVKTDDDRGGETNNFFIFDPDRVRELETLAFDVEGTAVEAPESRQIEAANRGLQEP